MTCRVSGLAVMASTLSFALLGCNQLLDNNAGYAAESDEAGTRPAPSTQPTSGGPAPPPGSDAGDPPPSGCPAAAPLQCAAGCVDPQSSVNDCGGCNVKCPAVANASTTCNGGVCAFACKAQSHACAGACVSATDPASCGPACTACPVPAGGSATCINDMCGATCHGKNVLCGGLCVSESAFNSDPLNCGICGNSCGGGACMKGVCKASGPN